MIDKAAAEPESTTGSIRPHRPTVYLLRRIVSVQEIGILAALGVLVAVISAFHPNFLSAASLIGLGRQASLYGILALGMVFLLSMRDIDISVGAVYAVSAIGAAYAMREGVDPWLGVIIGVLIGVGLGAVNGLLANVLAISTLIVTLGTLLMFKGVTLITTSGVAVIDLPLDHAFFRLFGGSFLRVPASVWGCLVLTALLTVVYRSTRFGFTVRAVGSNEQAARLSGIRIKRVRLLALMLMGGLCGVSAMFTLAFFGAADPNLGTGWEFLVISSAIIGGTSLAGGSGSVPGAIIGALVIATINSGLVHFGVKANWSLFATGSVLIAAVALDAWIRRRRAMRSS